MPTVPAGGEMRSMGRQKMLANLQLLRTDESLSGALLVALGTLFLLLSFTFYPIYLIPLLAALAGAVAYKVPPLGTILGMFLAFPAVAYQAPVLAWVFMLFIALALFEAWQHWSTISFLKIAILMPFAPFPFSLLSGFIFFALGVAALHFGSRHSFFVSLPAIFIVLLLSATWMVQSASFITISNDYENLYSPKADYLQNRNEAKPEVGIAEMLPEAGAAMGSLFSGDNIRFVGGAFDKLFGNALKLLAQDYAFIQLVVWAVALFALAFLPARFEHRYKQTISACALFLVPVVNFLVAPAFSNPAEPSSFIYCILSVGAIGVLESQGIKISGEKRAMRQAKQKSFGKFGLQDLGESEGVDSLADVGGYVDVKSELHEAIVAPIKQKELTYTYGIKPPTGILLFGPPGTGKTMLMKALAKELDIGFYYIKCSDLLSEWYGESLPYGEKIVIEENGAIRLEKIGRVVEEMLRAKVLSFDASGRAVFAEIKDFIKHRCTSPIYEVRTMTGRRIRVTGYHSLFTLQKGCIRSVKTSELAPKSSYIAIPSRIGFAEKPVGELDFLGHLAHEDFGLCVRGAQQSIRQAAEKVGMERACELLGLRRKSLLAAAMKKDARIRASRFLALMKAAGIPLSEKIHIWSYRKKLPGKMAIDERLAFFLGLWVAEGSYNRNSTVRISTSEKELPAIEKLCRGLFGHVTVYVKGDGRGRDIYIGSRVLYVLMRHYLGLEDGAGRKKVPEIAFSFSQQNMSAFLRGYFSGDGSIYVNQKGFGTVEASTTSRELSDQILYLLLYFGIVGRAYEKKEWTGSVSSRICLAGEPLRRFMAIGFADEERQEKLRRCASLGSWHRGPQVPIAGISAQALSMVPENSLGYDTVGREILLRHAGGQEESWQELLHSDIYWDRVEEIRRVEDEEYVYDISVEPCQNFAGGFGGIFAHNSEKNLAEVFSIARKSAPCVLFFDEIDSIGKKRDAYTSDDVAPRVMSVFLEELDGFKGKKNVITIGATNIPDQLDPALMRPGRFDKIIYMHLPDFEARKSIFKVHLSKLPTEPTIDYDKLAAKTERYSGADIKNICTEASRLAAREAIKSNVVVPITTKHLLTIISKVKPSVSLDMLDNYDKFRMDYERRAGAEEKKPEEAGVRWEDVAGLDEVRQLLLESIEIPLLHEELMKEMDVKPSKGLLLFGPPGCGKTMIVKAAANELNANFLTISGAELMKGKDRNPASYVKEVFNRARESAPALVFIDEIEALAPNRDEYRGGILTELLQELDGVKELKNVMLVGATNKPSALDPAILRPGRFDKIIYIPPPDAPAREQIFEKGLAKFKDKLNLPKLANATDGFSGADIASVCQEVKMSLVREKLRGKPIAVSTEAVMKVAGGRRPSITQKDLREYFAFMSEYGERK